MYIKLIIVGDGQQKEQLQKLSEPVKDQVYFTGRLDDIAEILNLFNIFTLSSYNEGTSLTVLEAMSCSVPVVCSNVGGNKSLIKHGYNGYLYDLNNHDQFDAIINRLRNNPQLRNVVGCNGREYVQQNYDINSMITKYYQLYSS